LKPLKSSRLIPYITSSNVLIAFFSGKLSATLLKSLILYSSSFSVSSWSFLSLL